MLDVARFLDLTGKITWWLSRTMTGRRNDGRRQPQKPATLRVEELEDRVVPTLLGQQLFPADYPWNQNIANAPVAANSAAVISHIGGSIGIHPDWGNDSPSNGSSPLYGIPYNVVHGNSVAKINVVIDNYPGESDVVDVPIPANAVIEGDFQNGPNTAGGGYNSGQRGDSHLIVWDEDNNIAYELFGVTRPTDATLFPNTNGVELTHTDGRWHAAQESVWHMNAESFRALGATSADAAGLSILAGLVRPDEGLPTSQGGQGAINHALRFTLPSGDVSPQYIYPASHVVSVSSGSTKLPFGARLRLMNTPAVNAAIASMGPQAQIIAHAMQQYGLVLADIGSAMYVTGSSAAQNANNGISATWNMNDVLGLHSLTASFFEVVNLTPIVTGLSANSGAAGNAITITGQNFSGSAGHLSVLFGSTPASSVTVVSDTQVTAVVPNGSGTVHVTVQSGVNATDNISSNPTANSTAPIFGYGTSAATSADQFTFGGVGISGTNSTVSFATSSVVSGATDVVTIVVKDTANSAVSGLTSSAFSFSLAGGASAGTFSPVTATATAGTYTTTFTGTTAGTASTLTAMVSGVTLTTKPTVQVTVGGVSGATSTASFATSTVVTGSTDTLTVVVKDAAGNAISGLTSSAFSFSLAGGTSTGSFGTVTATATAGTYTSIFTGASVGTASTLTAVVSGVTFTTHPTITVTSSVTSLPAPTVLTPSGAVVAANGYDKPTFTWAASAGADHYLLVVVDITTNTTPIVVSNITGLSYAATAAQALTPGHSFTTYVYALLTNTSLSSVGTKAFSLAALPTPTGLTPSGAIAANSGYDRPTFQWSAPGADHYNLTVVDNTTGTTAIAVTGLTSASYVTPAIQALTPGHTFTMSVTAFSTNGKVSTLAAKMFSLAALSAPMGLSPSGAIAAASGYDRPTFQWSNTPGADHYNLTVVDTTTGTAAIAVTGLTSASYATSVSQALTPGHGFTMYVYAVSTNGKASTVAAKAFSLAALSAPTGLSPSGVIAAASGYDRPTFRWNAPPGADHYLLVVVDNTAGTNPIGVAGITGTSYATPAAQALTPGHSFTWYVYGFSTNGKVYPYTASAFSLAPPGQTLTLSPATLTNATANSAYSKTLSATGGSGTYTFAVTTGSLPSWLTLNGSTGVLSGTPTTTGSSSFTVTATDSNNSATRGSKAYTLAVNAASTLTVSPTALANATANSAYSATVSATGGSGNYTFAVSAGTLPSWLTLNASTGVLSGTPTTPGTSASFTIRATDSNNNALTGTKAYTVTVVAGSGSPSFPNNVNVPPLPAPTGPVVNVSTLSQLQSAVANLQSGVTIVIAPGTYNLTDALYVPQNRTNVAIRGATGNRDDVVLVGAGMSGAVPYGIWAGNVNGITIADLTIRDVNFDGIILNAGVESPLIHNVHLLDIGDQMIKLNPDGAGGGVDNGIVEYSVMEYSAGWAPDYYVAGLDAHTTKNLLVQFNLFKGFRQPAGATNVTHPALLLWNDSENSQVLWNTFINNDRDISLGLNAMGANNPSLPDQQGGRIEGNMIYRDAATQGDVAIYVTGPNTKIYHNTYYDASGFYANGIEYRFSSTTNTDIKNNLMNEAIQARDGATGTVGSNLTTAQAAWFVNITIGDLHLKSTATAAIDQVAALTGGIADYDGQSRPTGGTSADYGADEYVP